MINALIDTDVILDFFIVDVLPTDKTTILKALNSPFKDFEDALQNYSAECT